MATAARRFDLVLCDLLMPDMSGMETYEQVVARAPEYRGRFLFMSGGVLGAQARAFAEGFDHPLLDKPFGAEELRRRVLEALGRC